MRVPFTRLGVPDASPSVQGAVSDIYDKLAAIAQAVNPQKLSPATVTQIVQQVQAGLSSGGGGGGGGAASAAYALIPQFPSLPSNNPVAGTPYTQDGLAIELAPTEKQPGSLYRYSLPDMKWAGPLLGGVLVDTLANQANYLPASYPGTLFVASDSLSIYYSNGTAWIQAGLPTGWDTMTPDGGGNFTPQWSAGVVHEAVLTKPIASIGYITGAVPPGQEYTIMLTQDATGGRQVNWSSYYHGLAGWEISTAANTYSAFAFKYKSSTVSRLAHAETGMPV
jgi:hypothetical protein